MEDNKHLAFAAAVENNNVTRLAEILTSSKSHGRICFDFTIQYGWAALHLAILRDNVAMAELLLDHGSNANCVGMNGFTPLLLASDRSNLEAVKLLLARGARVNEADRYLDTCLHKAVRHANLTLMELLLQHGASANVENYKGDTAFSLALNLDYDCEETPLRMVRLLVENGARAESANKREKSPLCRAMKKKHWKLIDYLLSVGVDVDGGKAEEAPIFAAVASGEMSDIERLIERGARVDLVNRYGESLLHVAILDSPERARLQVAKFLLDKKVDVDVISNDDFSALYCCVKQRDVDLFYYLLERGARVNTSETKGATILLSAIDAKLHEVAKYLIENKFLIDSADWEGRTPLSACIHDDNEELFLLLLQNGANANDKLALRQVARSGRLNMLQLLVGYGAEINGGEDDDDDDAEFEQTLLYMAAVESPHTNVVQYLLDVGYDVNARVKSALPLQCLAYYDDTYSVHCSREILIKRVVLVSFLNLHVDEENARIAREDERWREYECELRLMKATPVCDESSVTYLDVLAKRGNSLVRCLRNRRVCSTLKTQRYKELFEHYGYELKVHFLNGLQRLLFMKRFRQILRDLFHHVFPGDVIDHISEYFNLKDFNRCFDLPTVFSIIKNH